MSQTQKTELIIDFEPSAMSKPMEPLTLPHLNNDNYYQGNFHRYLLTTWKFLKLASRDILIYFWIFFYPIMMISLFGFIYLNAPLLPEINLTEFDIYSPGYITNGVIIAISMVGMLFGQEKELGVMARIDSTPIPRWLHMVSGATTQLIFSAIQIVVLMVAINLFGLNAHPEVNWGLAFLNAYAVVISCIGLGLIVASFAKSAGIASGIAWLFIFPLQFIGGGYYPFDLGFFGKLIPTMHCNDAMRLIILGGAKITEKIVWQSIVINVCFGIVTCLIGIYIFSKKSKL